MSESLPLATIIVSYVAVLFALSVHEAAHASASYLLGDDTARRMGRMTLSPVAHMDLVGTVIMPLIGAFTGFNVLGWAKPVPVDPSRLTRRFRARVGYAMVAAAGPVSNLLQSLLFLVVLCLSIRFAFPDFWGWDLLQAAMFSSVERLLRVPQLSVGQVLLMTLLGRLVVINIGLAIFNLIPFGPLDGAGILRGFLPFRWLPAFDRWQPKITIILLVLFLVGAFNYVFGLIFALANLFFIHPLARLILGV
nr:site-2 protease family protein [uncultured Holophaga sp.]